MPNISPGYNYKMIVAVIVVVIIFSGYERNSGGYANFSTNLGWT